MLLTLLTQERSKLIGPKIELYEAVTPAVNKKLVVILSSQRPFGDEKSFE